MLHNDGCAAGCQPDAARAGLERWRFLRARQIIDIVCDELRLLADVYLRRERPGHTLQPTELIHDGAQDPWNANGDYAPSSLDRPHPLVIH